MPVRLLVAYDGSAAADAAVVTAGHLFPAAHGRLVTLFDQTMAYEQVRRYGFGVDDTTLRRGVEALARGAREAGLEIAKRAPQPARPQGLRWSRRPRRRASANGRRSCRQRTRSTPTRSCAAPADAAGSGARCSARPLRACSITRSARSSWCHVRRSHSTVPMLVAYDGSPGARAAIGRVTRAREAAERHGAAVIVAGSRGRGGVASVLLGSVSSGLAHNAQTPTLIIPD
jgi:hypothetical protein